jgi:tetratricopeptide (TPR) repeat protein
VLAGDEKRLINSRIWEIATPVIEGEPLVLEVCFDENQILHVEMRVARETGELPFVEQIENPITHVINPSERRIRIEETEEELRTGEVPEARVPEVLVDLAQDYFDIGQRERALQYFRRALTRRERPSAWILNRMGMIAGELGDFARQEKLYRESASVDATWSAPLFNLALTQYRRGLFAEARTSVDQAIERERDAPYFVLKAQIAEAMGERETRESALVEGRSVFAPLRTLDDWALGWLLTAARMQGDSKLVTQVQDERQARSVERSAPVPERGLLPIRSEGRS